MKKAMCVVLVVFAAMAVVGCPATIQIPIPDVSVVSGDTSATQPPVVQQEMGKVIVSGKLYDPQAKGVTHDIGDLLKRQITSLNFFFYPVTGGECQSFFVPVVNGSFYAEMLVYPGQYNVYVEAVDCFYQALFTDYVEMKVGQGDNKLKVVLEMNRYYHYRFIIDGLPGEYNDFGQAIVTTNDGSRYYVSYSMQYLGGGMGKSATKGGGNPEQTPTRFFDAYLPVSFDGVKNQAFMAITDRNGKQYATDLTFNLPQAIEGVMILPYTYPSWLGDVTVDISFDYENVLDPQPVH